MNFHPAPLFRYVELAPLALSIERAEEAEIFSTKTFERPVLDIGCGDGIFADRVFVEKIDVGIDLDPDEVSKARKGNSYDELIVCPGSNIPKPDQHFRTIFSNSVLEHIPDLAPVLREAHRLLAFGGKFYVTIPTRDFEKFSLVGQVLARLGMDKGLKDYGAAYNRFWRHYNVHDENEWSERFMAAGFRVSAVTLYAPQPLCTLNDCLVPFALPAFAFNRLLRRWVAFPSLRRVYAGALITLIYPLIRWAKRRPGGGLAFFELTRD